MVRRGVGWVALQAAGGHLDQPPRQLPPRLSAPPALTALVAHAQTGVLREAAAAGEGGRR